MASDVTSNTADGPLAMAGIDRRAYRVIDVMKLVCSIDGLLETQHGGKLTGLFGWKEFALTEETRLRVLVSCETAKSV